MKKEYMKPDTKVVAVTSAYGLMEQGTNNYGGGTQEGGITEGYSKRHDLAIEWDDENGED